MYEGRSGENLYLLLTTILKINSSIEKSKPTKQMKLWNFFYSISNSVQYIWYQWAVSYMLWYYVGLTSLFLIHLTALAYALPTEIAFKKIKNASSRILLEQRDIDKLLSI